MKKQEYEVLVAAENPDWQQVVQNGGPPCFHVDDGEFCLRAQLWPGHEKGHRVHRFVPIRVLLESVLGINQPVQGGKA